MDLVPFENTFVTKSHIFVALKKMRDTIKYRTVMKGRYPQKGDFDSNLLICKWMDWFSTYKRNSILLPNMFSSERLQIHKIWRPSKFDHYPT